MSENDVIITYESLFDLLRIEKNKEELQKLDPEFFNQVIGYLEQKKAVLDKKDDQTNLFVHSEQQKTLIQLENIKKILKDLHDRREKKIIHMSVIKARTGTNIIDTSNMLSIEKDFYDELNSTLLSHRKNTLFCVLNGAIPKQNNTKISEKSSNIDQNQTNNNNNNTENNKGNTNNNTTNNNNTNTNITPNTDPISASETGNEEEQNSNQAKQTSSENSEDTEEKPTNLFSKSESGSELNQDQPNTTEGNLRIRILSQLEEIVGPDLEIYGPYDSGNEVEIPSELAEALINKSQAVRL